MRLSPGTLALLLLALPAAADAFTVPRDVWTVGSSGDFATIGEAIDAAAAGDRIEVEAGDYAECLAIPAGRPLEIVALDGTATITCSDGSIPTVGIEANTTLAGLAIRHTDGNSGIGAAAVQLRIHGCDFDELTYDGDGGAIWLNGTTAFIQDTTISNATATNYGGAIYVSNGTLELVDVSITDSQATRGGAIAAPGSTVQASRLSVEGSSATDYGGAIAIWGLGSLTVQHGDFSGNNAVTRGGAIYSERPVTLKHTDFGGNHVTDAGTVPGAGVGGALATTSTLNVHGGTFDGNTSSVLGGAAHVTGNSTFVGTTFTNNHAGASTDMGHGGAMYAANVLTTRDVTFIQNTAHLEGGALYAASTWNGSGDHFEANGPGSGVEDLLGGAASTHGTISLVGETFVGNTANAGGALYSQGVGPNVYDTVFSMNDATASLTGGGEGGAVRVGNGDARFERVRFESNSAERGGAVYADDRTDLVSSVLQGNQATYGAGMYATGNTGVVLSRTWFDENGTQDGTIGGGGLYLTEGWINAYESWFTNNQATDGAGTWISSSEEVILERMSWCGNQASSTGGAIYSEGYLNIDNSAVQENEAEIGGGAYIASNAYTTGVTFAGNVSTGALSGVVVDNYLYVWNSLLQYNGQYAISMPSGYIEIGVTAVGGYASTPFDGEYYDYGNNAYTTETWIPSGWSASDGDCFNDSLVAQFPYASYGAASWTHFYGDDDEDGYSFANRDCLLCEWVGGACTVAKNSHPGADELVGDLRDNDCDGVDDLDGDDDSFVRAMQGGGDCDDTVSAINPVATDIPHDGTDQDCDGSDLLDGDGDLADSDNGRECDDTDSEAHALSVEIFYDDVVQVCDEDDDDADRDGYHAEASGGVDCNDFRGAINPGVDEVYYDGLDQNCDGLSDYDADQDGFDAQAFGGEDCDDTTALVSPGSDEIWYDGFDSDCDGANDYDQDGDGFVREDYDSMAGGTAPGTGDCDDTEPNTYPGSPEITDGKDNTCDGVYNPDADLDQDGILDWWEDVFGTLPNVRDSDGDGIEDAEEWGDDEQAPLDTDDDGVIDALDTDSDDDGVLDEDELKGDSDGDGTDDWRDDDDDGDGHPTADERGEDARPTDTDRDGIPDYLDLDSDADGALDASESAEDSDSDGLPDYQDNGADVQEYPTDTRPEKTGFGGACDTGAPAGPQAAWLLLAAVLLRRRRES